jgi:hypothetical protein
MKSKLLLLIFISFLFSCKKEKNIVSNNATLIWNGFYHVWDYNHRINRLGDWIIPLHTKEKNGALLTHTGASGSGADKLNFTTFYTKVISNKIAIHQDDFSFRVYGKEGETIESNIIIRTNIPAEFDLNKKMVLLISGFDIFSRTKADGPIRGDEKADKIFAFGLNTSDLVVKDGQFQFNLSTKLGGDCNSPECITGENQNWFDYQIKLYYQIIGLPENSNIEAALFTNEYNWEKPSQGKPNPDSREIFRIDKQLKNEELIGKPNFKNAIIGFSGFDYNIEKGMGGLLGNELEYPHMIETDLALIPKNYDASAGKMLFDADLFFKNWDATMPLVSYGGAGSIVFNANINLIQWADEDAIVEYNKSNTGTINWKTSQTNQQPGNSAAAENQTILEF